MLIVLDACRYDLFNYMYPEMNAVECWSRAYTSDEWIRKEWGNNGDVTYITSNIFVLEYSDEMDENVIDVNESKVIRRRKPKTYTSNINGEGEGFIMSNKHDPISKTTSDITFEFSKEYINRDKVVIHVMEPHVPFINGPPYYYKDEHGPHNILTVYIDNIKYAMDNTYSFIQDVEDSRDVFITADHADCLGEDGVYGHDNDHDALHHVPWVEIDNTDRTDSKLQKI